MLMFQPTSTEGGPLPSGSFQGHGPSHSARALILALVAAAVVVLLFLIFGHIQRLSEVGRASISALFYSICIALPSAFALSRIPIDFTAKHSKLVVLIRVGILLATTAVGSLFSALLLAAIGVVPWGEYWAEFAFAVRLGAIISLVFGLGISFYETLRYKLQVTALELRTRQIEEERARKLLAEARLSSLESRIHPHFLFNTLNSIAALIPQDPQRAENMVGKLASLLRFSLNASQASLVSLEQELKVVRDYLNIEQARFGQRLRYVIDVPESLLTVAVPPLSIETLVENSVKHAAAPRPQGGEIRIRARLLGVDRIDLEVIDDGPGFSLEKIPEGHGLENLISRLNLLFGVEAHLEVDCEEAHTTVRLSLPILKGAGQGETNASSVARLSGR
jgi:sensor histidine kinase YesM